jgi:hypothetical protein
MAPGLIRNHPEQMQAVSLTTIDCKNLLVNSLGIGQLPGLMEPNSICQQPPNHLGLALLEVSIALFCEGVLVSIHQWNLEV